MTLVVSASAYAQAKVAKSTLDIYDKGVAAAKAQKWQDAINFMKQAIATDATPRSYREGVIPIEYFPQYYLFVSYVGMKDWINARSVVSQRGLWPPKLVADAKASFDALATEDKRVADAKKDADAAEAKRTADAAEAKRVADAAEAKRIADAAEAKRIADAAEAKRVADAAEARRLADQRAADLRDFNALLARADTAYNQKNWGS